MVPGSDAEGVLELGVAADPPILAEPLGLHVLAGGKPADRRTFYAGDETVRRFRPFARRRFRTSRPFFVLMRTRKPCVRRRRRRLGWNVRFMISDPLSPEINGGETSMVAKAEVPCQS